MDSKLAAGIVLVQQELDKIDGLIAKELKASSALQRQVAASKQEQQRLGAALAQQQLHNISLSSERADLQVVLGSRQRQQEAAAQLRQRLKVRALSLLCSRLELPAPQPVPAPSNPAPTSPSPTLRPQDEVAQEGAELEALACSFEASSDGFCAKYSLEALEQQITGIKEADRELRIRLKALVAQFRQSRAQAEAQQRRAQELRGARDALLQEVQGAWAAAGSGWLAACLPLGRVVDLDWVRWPARCAAARRCWDPAWLPAAPADVQARIAAEADQNSRVLAASSANKAQAGLLERIRADCGREEAQAAQLEARSVMLAWLRWLGGC
jgi:hypothetical protein